MSSFQRLIQKFNQSECINRQDFVVFLRARSSQFQVFALSACGYCILFVKLVSNSHI